MERLRLASMKTGYDRQTICRDILAGLVIMAVSVPISMGYAQIAGLPAVYGLYGSVFPILIFALCTSSPQLVFGVDAAPAALVGAALSELSVESGSKQAQAVVPVLTLFVAIWLLVFFLLKAGRLVNYISAPVMGGFITGICTTIILMQIPKLMGGDAGTGELPELAAHIAGSLRTCNGWSLLVGLASLTVLQLCKKLCPKFPMAVCLMAAGAFWMRFFPAPSLRIRTLQSVEPGLPRFGLPDLSAVPLRDAVTISLSVAVVIMAESLLAENQFAQKNRYRIDDNRELLAFSLGNFVAAFSGCCPINGSVSRTAMGEQYQAKSQLTGLTAGLGMIVLLLVGTGFIGYLPVPVLTAIVISALLGATEFPLAVRLWKVSKTECFIFAGAFFGVLMLGTINGVLIGIMLSFCEMIIRSSKPARCFLGVQPGHSHFRAIGESSQICEIEGVLIYRFSSNLFFANVQVLVGDIEDHLQPDTKAVIIDAGGIGSIDITAADALRILYDSLQGRGIRFYMTEHIAGLNDQLRRLGLGDLIEKGCVRRTIHIALKDMGIQRPYPLQGGVKNETRSAARKRADNRVQEFVWAFGEGAEEQMERQIKLQIAQLQQDGDVEGLLHGRWAHLEELDADEWLEHLEEHLQEIVRASGKDEQTLAIRLEERRREIYRKMQRNHPELAERFLERREILDRNLQDSHPEIYAIIVKLREKETSSD